MTKRPQLFDVLKDGDPVALEDYFAGRVRKKQSARRQFAVMVAREVIKALEVREQRRRPAKRKAKDNAG